MKHSDTQPKFNLLNNDKSHLEIEMYIISQIPL